MDASTERVALLKAVPLFQSLGTKEMKAVLRIAKEVDHAPGHEIVGEGQSGIGFHLILSGEASVSQGGTSWPCFDRENTLERSRSLTAKGDLPPSRRWGQCER
jgi:CRP-like cAMP-binding protein